MRLFAALPVDGEARDELVRVLERLRRRDWPVKWVRDDGLHVTLKFLGEVDPERAPAVATAIRDAVRETPTLPFTPTELGAFPNPSQAKVLWAGYQTETALELMVHRIEQATGALGFPIEGRAFRPHVTLGRVRDGARLPREAAELLRRESLAAGFTSERVVLFQSHTGAGGARYVELDSFSLGV